MRKLYSILVSMLLLTGFCSSAANSSGLPENVQDGNILHCFNWNFNDIKAMLPDIAKAGFVAVQVSPVQGNCGQNAEWYFAYMPYDFAFKANGHGSRTQLQSLCTEADKYGIKIIVDVVANHINPSKGYRDTWWDSNGRERNNGGINYSDRYSVTHNNLGNYHDVNSESEEVQLRCLAFINDLKSIGVKGIRWDAAKHIGLPSENCAFWNKVLVSGMYHYGEMLDGPGGPASSKYNLLKEYASLMSITDTDYSTQVRNAVVSGSVPGASGNWVNGGVPANRLVYWGESHDEFSNSEQRTTNIAQDKIDRAWAINACRNGVSALYFSRPPTTGYRNIRIGVKGSTHFTSPEIAAVNHFRNAMGNAAEYYSNSNGIAVITRKNGGAVIVIGAGGSRSVSVPNGGGYVPAGTYTDEVTGNKFTVTSSTISGQVGASGIAVVYDHSAVPDPTPDKPGYIYLVGAPTGWLEPATANSSQYDSFKLNETEAGSKIYKGSFKIDADKALFRFYSTLSGWDGGDSYGCQVNDVPKDFSMTNGTYSGVLVNGKGSYNFPDWKGGTINMTVDMKNMTVEFKDAAGVELISADDAVVDEVYYNLQGQRLSTLAPGTIAIRVARLSSGKIKVTKTIN